MAGTGGDIALASAWRAMHRRTVGLVDRAARQHALAVQRSPGATGFVDAVERVTQSQAPGRRARSCGGPVGVGMSEQRNVVEVLTHDHREVEELFGQIEAAAGDAELVGDLIEQITIELVRHSVAEEQWLYPAVRERVDGGAEIADREIAEHGQAEQLLKDLERLEPADRDYWQKLVSLMTDVRQHIGEEEGEVFPKLIASSTPDQLRDLGAKVEAAKKTAPTRPHPSSPSTPPANKILSPGVGLIDRLRAALTGRH